MIPFIASSLAFSFAFLLVFYFYQKKGQFDDPEDVKFQIFRDDENSKGC